MKLFNNTILSCFLISIIAASLGSACTKKRTSTDNALVGKWQFEYKYGGFSGHDSVKASPDAVTVMIINADNTYSRTINNETVAIGKYDFVTVKSMFTNQSEKAIRFDSSAAKLIKLNEPQLTLYDNHTEPYYYGYKRIK